MTDGILTDAAGLSKHSEDPGFDGPTADRTGVSRIKRPVADQLTLVHVPEDCDAQLTKVVTPLGTSAIDDLPYLVNFETVDVHGIPGLLGLLEQLAQKPRACVIRAEPLERVAQPCRRLGEPDVKRGDPQTVREVPRAWVLIDFDSVKAPEGLDFTQHPEKAAEHLRGMLPQDFRTASCVWRASSNAGLKPGIRLHLWFLLSAGLCKHQLDAWLQPQIKGELIDASPFKSNQPHFTADPVFEGRPDPMVRRRGTLRGAPRVTVPEEIVQLSAALKPAGGPRAQVEDRFKQAALERWEADFPFDPPGPSERIECPACGSSDGIHVREDDRWNCHGHKHATNAPHIGTHTGNVWVGHRIEFELGLSSREVTPWLKANGYWVAPKLPAKFHKQKEATQQDGSETASGAAPAFVTTAAPVNLRFDRQAHAKLKQALQAVRRNTALLPQASEEVGRYMAALLYDTVVRDFQMAVTQNNDTRATIRTAEQALPIIEAGLARGMEHPRNAIELRGDDSEPALPLDENGQPVRSAATAYYFCSRPQIRDAIAYDVRSMRVVVIETPPWWTDDDRDFPRPLEDEDLPRLSNFIAGRFNYPHASGSELHATLRSIAADRRWDPVEDYLETLEPWEGTPEKARKLLGLVPVTLLGVQGDSPYLRAVFMRWLIAAVQRTYEPGCQFREVLTLIGKQNIGKSTFLKTLCNDPAWFSDTVSADGSKDSRSALDGKLIVEFGELDKHMRDDRTGAFKNYISTRVDSYRRSYGHVDQDVPRRCVFAATSNVDRLFVDPTGNTRFNVLEVTKADCETLRNVRDELWKSALHLYRAGEPSFLQPEEKAGAEELQRAHYDASSAESALHDLWDSVAPDTRHVLGNDLGFTYEPAQVAPDGRFKLLTVEQMDAFLTKRGLLKSGDSRRALASVTHDLNLSAGRVGTAIPKLTRKSARARPEYLDFLTK